MLRWAKNRGYSEHNPCARLEQAKERKRRRLPDDQALKSLAESSRSRGACTARRTSARMRRPELYGESWYGAWPRSVANCDP